MFDPFHLPVRTTGIAPGTKEEDVLKKLPVVYDVSATHASPPEEGKSVVELLSIILDLKK